MRSRWNRALPAVVLAVLSFANVRAESAFKFTPGLLHGTAPRIITAALVPARSFADGNPTALAGFYHPVQNQYSSTLALQAVAGPLGASRLLGTTEDPNCDDFWGPDKWRHVAVWSVGTLGIYLFFKTVFKTSKLVSYLLSATAMSMIGLAREFSDSNSEKDCFSEQDLLANTLGILAAGVVITIF